MENKNHLDYFESLGEYKKISVPKNASFANGTYVQFGTYPQTIIASDVTVDESTSITKGAINYYLGSDGFWYAKCVAKPSSFNEEINRFTNGCLIKRGKEYYFKVEPIVWRVLKEEDGMQTLFAEKILTSNIQYFCGKCWLQINGDVRFTSSFRYSNINAWLNGIKNMFITDGGEPNKYTIDWTNKGFLQAAFTEKQQSLMVAQKLKYENLNKIYLLSYEDVHNNSLGFCEKKDRIRHATDYAKANNILKYLDPEKGGWWWLRTAYIPPCDPFCYDRYTDEGCGNCGDGRVRKVDGDGGAEHSYSVDCHDGGIVPAVTIIVEK